MRIAAAVQPREADDAAEFSANCCKISLCQNIHSVWKLVLNVVQKYGAAT